MPAITPLIRLFISSTFSDFKFEREVLQRAVFPRLRKLCAARGCRFQPIDLRWGVSDEAGIEKRTLTICLDEIARCQRLSPDLNLLILLGDRYGSCFLPEQIPSEQITRLMPHLEPIERERFAHAYAEDHNALQPEFVLLPSERTGVVRQGEQQLRLALAHAAEMAGFTELERLPFLASATHLEIQRGLLDANCDPAAAICAIRSFTSLPEEEWTSQYVEREADIRERVEALTEAVEKQLDEQHIWRYGVPGELTGPRMDEAARIHQKAPPDPQFQDAFAHFDALAEQFYALLEPRIQQALARRQVAAESRDPVALANRQFAEARASVVIGRESELKTIATYLSLQAPFPLIVTGPSGVGKSTLLARAVQDARRAHPNAVIVTRYIGVTPETSSLADLLTGLRREIAGHYGQPDPEPLGELSQLVAAVARQLGMLEATAERPLFLFIDALDQLGSEHQRVDWLPPQLAPNVHLVVSILADREELLSLRAWVSEARGLQLDPLARTDGAKALRAWLAAEGRQVTTSQEKAVLDGFASEPDGGGLPLYLRLAFERARTWRSFDAVPTLPSTVPALIQTYLTELQHPGQHGKELVAFALAYLAAARHGLAEDELLDLLSRSETVRYGLHQLSPRSPRIGVDLPLPMSLWARLAADLDRYLAEREADGAHLIAFYHRQVHDEVQRLFLDGTERMARHAELAAYFDEQPFRLGEDVTGSWNRRKLAELTYQQDEAGPAARTALEKTLTDGRFLEGKLTVEGVAATLDDLSLGLDKGNIDTIATVVRAGTVVLTKDPAELENQIRGRVGSIKSLHHLPGHPTLWLRLRTRSLTTDRALVQILQGHSDEVVNCALSADGARALAASEDGTLRVWDSLSGETLRILDDHERRTVVTEGRTLRDQVTAVDGCAFSADGRRALSLKSGVLRLWDTTSGRMLQVFSGQVSHLGKTGTCCALSADGRLALFSIVSINGLSSSDAQKVSLWDTTSGQTRATWNLRGSYVLACILSADGTRALVASRDGGIWVWNTTTQQVLRTLPLHTEGLASCTMSADGRRVLSASEAGELRLWDVETGRLLRTLQGHQGRVYRCVLNADGQVALSATTDGIVRLWNTDTGTVVRALDESSLRTVRSLDYGTACALSADGRRFLTTADQHTLQLWDTTREEMPAGVEKGWEKGVTACALNDDGQIALTGYENGTLRTWDTTTKQLLHTWKAHGGVVHVCTLSADGQVALSLAEDAMRVWDTASGRALIVLKNHPGTANVGALSADGRVAVSVRLTALMGMPTRLTLRLWDIRRKRVLRTLKGISGAGGPCALCADGRMVIAASQEGFSMRSLVRALVSRNRSLDLDSSTLRMWDATSGSILRTFLVGGTVTECVLSADGQRVLYTADSALAHGALYSWDSVSGRPLFMLAGDRREGVVRCASSADGRQALSASVDGTLRLWDSVDGHELTRWTHDRAFRACALSANGQLAVAVDMTGSIHVLDVVGKAEIDEVSD